MMEVKRFVEVKCYHCHSYYEIEMPPAQMAQVGGYAGTCPECNDKVSNTVPDCYYDD